MARGGPYGDDCWSYGADTQLMAIAALGESRSKAALDFLEKFGKYHLQGRVTDHCLGGYIETAPYKLNFRNATGYLRDRLEGMGELWDYQRGEIEKIGLASYIRKHQNEWPIRTDYLIIDSAIKKLEASIEVIDIIRTCGQWRTEGDYEKAIEKLIELLVGLDSRKPYDVISLANELLTALENMARECGREAQVALRVLATPWGSLWDDTSARCLAAKLLAECGCNNQDALSALTRLLDYSVHGGTDHYNCCEGPVRDAARDALTKLHAGLRAERLTPT
jgi:hypothetical protein